MRVVEGVSGGSPVSPWCEEEKEWESVRDEDGRRGRLGTKRNNVVPLFSISFFSFSFSKKMSQMARERREAR